MEPTYDELVGGAGRAIYYRAERFRPRALLPRVPTRLEVAKKSVRLHDFSATGFSFHIPATESPPEIGIVVPFSIKLEDLTAFSGRCEVVRASRDWSRCRVGARFLDVLLEPNQLKGIHDRVAFEQRARRGLDTYQEVPASYRQVCAEAMLFLNHWKSLLDDRERSIREARGSNAESALREIETLALDIMRKEWAQVHAAANAAVSGLVEGDEAYDPTRLYTETQVTPLMQGSPFWWRAYTKPLGYPGDFVAMHAMYEREPLATTVFGRVLDQIGFDERLVATVPERKELLKRHIAEVVSSVDRTNDSIRITCLGCGPAREVEEFLREFKGRGQIQFTLIDQDDRALAFAHERVKRAAIPHGDRVSVDCRYLSFRQLFSNPAVLSELGDQDLLYTAGLFDYLDESVATALVTRAFSLLRPGGRMGCGNAAAEDGVRWVPEFVLDWHMVYRTENDMRRLADQIRGNSSVQIQQDGSGTWHFLVADRTEVG